MMLGNSHSITLLLSKGVVTSRYYPGNYDDNLEQTQAIQVEQGQILSLEFTSFDIEYDSNCTYDHLTIMDGDGTTLMEKSCGGFLVIGGQNQPGLTLPAKIMSRSNRVNFVFVTDESVTRSGWSVKWSVVTPGEGLLHKHNLKCYCPSSLILISFILFLWV